MAKKPPLAPVLLPIPRSITLTGGTLALTPGKLIVLTAQRPGEGFSEAQEAQRALSEYAGLTWHIHAGFAVPDDRVGLVIEIEGGADLPERVRQAYRLTIGEQGIRVRAAAAAGAFYGVMTLTQLLRQYGDRLPQLDIEDAPDFPRRGVMLDVSRDKVPTMTTLFELVDMFAGLKLNELQLYTEHTFAYQRHPVVWANASPLTGEEIMQLDAYCRARHIDLVPNQNCFGHLQPWLIHDAYRHLAECPEGCDTRWGRFDQPFSLCPGDPGSLKLVEEMLDELLPHFTSGMVNVGCDETVDLGSGRSKADVEARGVGRVYLDFVLKIHALVKRHGRTMQFWGDIIMEHPELVPELPKDLVAMEWGYEFDHPFAEHGTKFAAAGIPFYVVPGTSSWNSIGGRTDNAIGNLLNAAENGLKHGAIGYLITDWGDRGHHQPLPVSFLPFGYGASVSWCLEENRDVDIARGASLHLFGDPSGATGRFAFELGNVYAKVPGRIHNATAYAVGVTLPDEDLQGRGEGVTLDRATLSRVNKEIERLERIVPTLAMRRADAALIRREFAYALGMMRYGMGRIARILLPKAAPDDKAHKAAQRKVLSEHRKVWLSRNRPGGMTDSAAKIKF